MAESNTDNNVYWLDRHRVAKKAVDYAESQLSYPELEVEGREMLRFVIEGMTKEQLAEHKAKMLSEISDRETIVNIINEVSDASGFSPDAA